MTSVITDRFIGRAADELVDTVWRQIGYVWNYKSNIEVLNKRIKKLEGERKRVLHQVEEAKCRGEEIEEIVDLWLKDAIAAIEAGNAILQEDNDRAMNSCLIGCVNPNWKTRYILSRKAKEEIPAIDELQKEKNFGSVVGYRVSVQKLDIPKDYEPLDSRTLILNGIIEALKDVEVHLIGVHGMGGIGKTTLVRQQVAARVKGEGLYNVVAIAEVAQNPDLNKVQQQIADWLGFTFDVQSTDVRATRLLARLKQEEKVLVILDNVWDEISFRDIGIPYGNDHKGCKILMTSRDLNLLSKMGLDRDFKIQVLQDEEAWKLFEKNSGRITGSEMQEVAIQVAKRCAGLPILIVAVARALRNKGLFEWKNALEALKNFDNEEIESKVYSALELSYRVLGDDEKSLFRLCGQLQPHNLLITDLLKCSVGLGLFTKRFTLQSVRNRLLTVVNNLKKSSLLLEGDNDDQVKMHDVVHGFAASVASKLHHVFAKASDAVVKDWWEEDISEECTAISLPYCKIPPLSVQVFQCPKLQSFMLLSKDPSLTIPDDFFIQMKELKVLILRGLYLSPLPSSLKSLKSLRTLCLHDCVLEDLAAIGELRKVQVLSLDGSSVTRLPIKIGELTRLHLLDLRNCSSLEEIPAGVLSRLTQLEDLHMGNSFVQWEGAESNGGRKNANLAELNLLPELVTLDIHIHNAEMLPGDRFPKTLERFRIFIGRDWNWSGGYKTSRTLKLTINAASPINELERVKDLLRKTEDLRLNNLKGVKCVLYKLDGEGFPQLKHLHVQNSQQIQYVVDQMRMGCRFIAFPELESLVVDNLNSLEKICHGQLMLGSFSKLRKLKVGNCNVLKNLFPGSMFRGLELLEEIDVNGCKTMEEIVFEDDGIDRKDEVIELKLLRSLTLEYLPQLKSFCSSPKKQELQTTCTSTMEITSEVEESETSHLVFSKKIQFPGMKELKLSSINMEKIWPDKQKEVSSIIQNLTSLIVEGCGNLSYLFTSSMVKSLAQLKKLEISNCNLVREVIVAEELEEIEVTIMTSIPNLESMKLKGLPIFRRFCTTNLFECPSLKVLWLENCPLLQTFISTSVTRDALVNNETEQGNSTLFDEKVSFPNLEELHITHMHKLKMIWHDELREDSFCKLKVLKIKYGSKLSKFFSFKLLRRFQNVEEMVVENCSVLEDVFDMETDLKVQEIIHVAVALRNLIIKDLPNLKHVWNGDAYGVFSFDNLRVLEVWSCQSLKSLFPFSIAQGLPQLECVEVDNCGVEELVAIAEERMETNPVFVFPRLKILLLWHLKELKCFYSSEHTLECPLLESLTVCDCKKLYVFTFHSQDMKAVGMVKQQRPYVQPLFYQRQIVGNLRRLGLNYKDITTMVEGQFPVDFSHKLKDLDLDLDCSYDASADFSIFHLLEKFTNVEILYLRRGNLKELVPHGNVDDGDAGLVSQIRILRLDGFPKMRHLWNEDCQVLQNLQTLELWQCHGLINLAPSNSSFQNLITLDVWRCHKLVNLLSISTAQNMVNLTNITVRECAMVTRIVSNDADESQSQSEIIFKKLETLILYCLRSLTIFCSSPSCIIKFPSLEQVIVSQCPKIKSFSHGVLSAPMLNRVYLTRETDDWRWNGDLDNTIKQLSRELVGFSGREYVRLSEFPQLQEAWHDQLPVTFFYNLRWLDVGECAFSASSVPSSLLPFLNNLEVLEVRNCHAVEQVFDLERLNEVRNVGYLSKLKFLRLIDLPRLRLLWSDFPKGNFDFKNLKVLKVYNCSSLKYILTPILCFSLSGLQQLAVKYCDMVEEIITAGSAKEEMILPLMKSITLESLPRLINLSSESNILQCPSLEEISVVDCPASFTSSFLGEKEPNVTHGITKLKVDSPNIMDLKLLSLNIEKIWHGQMLEVSTCIKNLTSLTIHDCGNLQYVLSSLMVKSVVHLRRIEICNCKMMKEIIVMEGLEEETRGKMLLRELDFLKLKDLPRLAQFCTGNSIECPVLKQLWIENCPELRTFISTTNANIKASSEIKNWNSPLFDYKVAFPNLEELKLLNISSVKVIWSNELSEDSFFKLKKLVIQHAKELQIIFPSYLVRSFQNLECLHIQGSDALQEVFDLKELKNGKERNAAVATQLKILEVCRLPNLKHLWNEDPQGLVEFRNLCLVDASDCPSLKCLFPSSIARSLPDLEQLQIVGCGIEEIVSKEEGTETPFQFEFPKLSSMVLRSLPKLYTFFQGAHTINCPLLKKLSVSQCARIQIFAPEIQNFQGKGREEWLHIQSEQPFVSFTEIICNLEELAFNSEDVTLIGKDQLPEDFFHKLKVLELNYFDNDPAIFPFDLLQRFPNLEKLLVLHSEFKELFPHSELCRKKNHEITLAKLQYLRLDKLSSLKYIWHPDSQLEKVLQTLEKLEIWNCDSLINIAIPSASLRNLTNLDVVNCKGLVNLMTSSEAKSMVNLRRLSIKECYMMREVVSDFDEDETSDEIIFVQLESLELHCLSSLTFFSSGRLNFKFPSLTEIITSQCPKLQEFSKGAVNTEILQRVLLTKERDRECWNGNLNSTIKLVNRDGMHFS